jgi:tRNA-splicing ligase RtcB (3'-phosphate/5'-hydroxy nucleic acid ligase)
MKTLVGTNGKAIVYTNTIEPEAEQQIKKFLHSPAAKDAHVRIMPDVHAGAGCVIGFTAKLTDKVIPNLIGVDIGCGITAIRLKSNYSLDLGSLDRFVRTHIPSGQNIHSIQKHSVSFLEEIKHTCNRTGQDLDYVMRSLGTLGGGNHFIEADRDEDGNFWILVHTGSRNFGLKVAKYHQKIAKKTLDSDYRKKKIEELKKYYSGFELGERIRNIPVSFIEPGLEYLEGENLKNYLFDMKVAQVYAHHNREAILEEILNFLGLKEIGGVEEIIESVHNYIDTSQDLIRKGAIEATKRKKLIIPLNMRDGAIIGIGKGNPDWNYSAPHGSGRVMSRTKAKKDLDLSEFKKTMEGIYSTSVNVFTLDESPMAYKSSEEIISYLEPTVEIKRYLRPVWNFKANE